MWFSFFESQPGGAHDFAINAGNIIDLVYNKSKEVI
jgi:hypothetical protein